MDYITLHHVAGNVEMRTIRVNNELVLILMKNKNNERWFAQTQNAKSFKEIHMIEAIKSSFFLRDNGNEENWLIKW